MDFLTRASKTSQEFDQQIVDSAGNPLFVIPKPPDPKLPDPELQRWVQSCLDRKSRGKTPQ